MNITCYNCQGARYVYNGFKSIACPVCGNRGDVEWAEQPDLFDAGHRHVHISQIKPDHRQRRIKS